MSVMDVANATAQDLVKNPNLLLHKKGLEGTRTAFDGKVGSVIQDGQFFVISPNMDHIYLPPFGRDRVTRLRMDGRFADDDHLVGPQPYLPQYCHYAAIPRWPKYDTDPLAIMWWIPTRKDFVYCSSNVISGLGKLDPTHLALLGQQIYALHQRVVLFKKDTSFAAQKAKPVLTLATSLDHAFSRLESLPTSFRQVQFGVALLQRCFLELTAHLDYLYIYHPMMTGQLPPATSVAHTIGAYAFDDVVVQEFVRAGLPVWIVKSFTYLHGTRIDSVVSALPPKQWAVLEDAIPPYHSFFTGPANSAEKYHAFGVFARRIVGYPDPFADTRVPNRTSPAINAALSPSPPQSTAGPVRSSNKSVMARQPYPKQNPKPCVAAPIVGRNKFIELDSPLIPPSIAAWSDALALVDRDPRNMKFATRRGDAGYVFPDPGLFVGVNDAQKIPKYLHNWLRHRQALIFRLASGNSSALPISPQLWRTLLNFGGDGGDTSEGSSVIARRRAQVAELLGNCVEEEGIELGSTLGNVTYWREQQLQPDVLPPVGIVHEILWELYELNFRFEFVALDTQAGNRGQHLDERQHMIMACFPGNHGGSLLVADVEFGAKGLAASAWKDRSRYVLAMVDVIKAWSGCPSSLLSLSNRAGTCYSEEEIIMFEKDLAKFYTQSFFDYFGRAAIVPRRLNR